MRPAFLLPALYSRLSHWDAQACSRISIEAVNKGGDSYAKPTIHPCEVGQHLPEDGGCGSEGVVPDGAAAWMRAAIGVPLFELDGVADYCAVSTNKGKRGTRPKVECERVPGDFTTVRLDWVWDRFCDSLTVGSCRSARVSLLGAVLLFHSRTD
jgi:hypothetical protein